MRFYARVLLIGAALALLVAGFRGPARLAGLMSRAEVCQAHKEYTRAISLYSEVMGLQPEAALPHLRLGQIYLAQGRYGQAKEEFEDAWRLDPRLDDALLGLGRALDNLGDEEGAVQRWRQAVALNSANAEAHRDLGLTALDRSLWTEAREEFEISAHYRDEASQYYLGVLLAGDDPAEAVPWLLGAIDAHGPLAQAASQVLELLEQYRGSSEAQRAAALGHMYLRLGLLSLAKEELTRAVELGEGSPAQSYLGYVLWALGDYEGARAVLDEASKHYPLLALNYYSLGLVYGSLGSPLMALAEFAKALKLDPQNAAVCVEIAKIYLGERNYPEARRWYREAEERAPQDAEFYLLRAQFHLEYLIWPEEGVEAAQQAVALEPENALAWDLLGWGKYLTGRPEDALVPLEKAIGLDPDLASAYYHLGLTYARLARKDEARWAYGRAVDLDSQGMYRERAEKALAALD